MKIRRLENCSKRVFEAAVCPTKPAIFSPTVMYRSRKRCVIGQTATSILWIRRLLALLINYERGVVSKDSKKRSFVAKKRQHIRNNKHREEKPLDEKKKATTNRNCDDDSRRKVAKMDCPL